MKKARGFENDFEDEIDEWRDSENRHDQNTEWDRKKDFAEMKAGGGGDVEIEIGVMNIMEAPEERDEVGGVVPPVIGPVHEEKSGHRGDRAGKRQPMEQAKLRAPV